MEQAGGIGARILAQPGDEDWRKRGCGIRISSNKETAYARYPRGDRTVSARAGK
jgi:hypothetical protein